MKTIKMLFVFSFLLFVSLPAAAQEQSKTAQIIDELTKKAQNIESYRVDTEIKTSAMGEDITTKGTMSFKKPNMMHMTTTTDMMGGMKQEMFKSDDTVWTYMPIMKMASKVDLAKVKQAVPGQQDYDESDLTKTLKDFSKDSLTFIEKKKVDDKEVYVFQMAPEKFQPDMTSPQKTFPVVPQKMEFLVYADSGLPYKMIMYGKDGSVMMEQTYTNYQLNVPVHDSEFQFTPPEGVQVMDMTEATINMMKQMQGQGEAQPTPGTEAQPAPEATPQPAPAQPAPSK
jgi:outer membrane lipoprotein-sorting protein